MVHAVASLLVAIALAVGAGPIAWDLLQWSGRVIRWPLPDTLATIGGAVAGLAFVCWRRPNWFIHTWIHEHAHLLVYAVLHLRMPRGLIVRDGAGGAIEHVETDVVRATLVRIAPYTLPLLLAPALFARHVLVTAPGPWRHALSALCAFLVIHHLQSLYHNLRINLSGDQSDLVKVGRPLSFVLIALALMLLAVWTVHALWRGLPSGW